MTGAEKDAVRQKLEQFLAGRVKKKPRNFSLKITREQGLYLQYRLKLAGRSCADVAREVGCTRQTVTCVLNGSRSSRTVAAAVARALGHSSWNSMVQSLRDAGI
ncbi:MAG: hypothetical protein K2H09_07065 [Treponemataceae bacterium]|nr:hypothetical protein [Treponemataceae bacterium]